MNEFSYHGKHKQIQTVNPYICNQFHNPKPEISLPTLESLFKTLFLLVTGFVWKMLCVFTGVHTDITRFI